MTYNTSYAASCMVELVLKWRLPWSNLCSFYKIVFPATLVNIVHMENQHWDSKWRLENLSDNWQGKAS